MTNKQKPMSDDMEDGLSKAWRHRIESGPMPKVLKKHTFYQEPHPFYSEGFKAGAQWQASQQPAGIDEAWGNYSKTLAVNPSIEFEKPYKRGFADGQASQPNQGGWCYDMDKAPKDGSQFLVYDPNRPYGDYIQAAKHIYADDDGSGSDTIGGLWCGDGRENCRPTAWKNIAPPQPPKE